MLECKCQEGKVCGDAECYWRVEFLGGCETLRVEDRHRMTLVVRERDAGNKTNLRIGSGAQQTRKFVRGVTHRGGEKPRGWNRIWRLVGAGPKGLACKFWKWTRMEDVDGEA